MTIRTTTLAAGVAMAMMSSVATAEFSANVALTSDYVFRGISQADEDPAIQGGFDYSHESGFYLGTWGSNVEQGNANLELDYYAGFAGDMGNGLSYDVGALYYDYPDETTFDFWEGYGSLSYDFGAAAVTVGAAYSPDYFGGSDNALFYYGEVAVPLAQGFSVSAHVGRQEIDDNTTWGTPDYTEYKVGVAKDLAGFGLALDYTDTDLNNSECFGGSDYCEGRVVFTVSKEF